MSKSLSIDKATNSKLYTNTFTEPENHLQKEIRSNTMILTNLSTDDEKHT